MKKLITYLFASIFITNSFAQYRNEANTNDDQQNNEAEYNAKNYDRNSNGIYNNNTNAGLVVSSASQNKFVVTIDNGREYQSIDNNGYGNTVNIGTVQTGNHSIAIYELKRSFFGNRKQEKIYSSVLFFKQGTEINIGINYNGQVSINEKPLYNNGGYNGNGSSCNAGNNGYGRGYGYGRRKNKHRRYENDDIGNYNEYPSNRQQISDIDFNNIKRFVQKESFDDRRINIVKQAATSSYFSTNQVKDLMSTIVFDEGRLDIAKYFYNRTIDRNNYYQLTDALAFSTSKDALLQFISNGR